MIDDQKKTIDRIRAYFCHSYRSEDKHRNLFFWNLFSEAGFYFTVDQKPFANAPMDITYVEWLMRRSDCFIAVIPRRPRPEAPNGCSPYQFFENGLAVRAHKPRLIFAEESLPHRLFRGLEEEICFFHPTRYEEQVSEFRKNALQLIKKAQAQKASNPGPRRHVTLISGRSDAYSAEVVNSIRKVVQDCGYDLRIFDPFVEFESDALFTLDIEEGEIVISETRWPHIPLDLLTSVHQRCIPIIRLCHLEADESIQQATQLMNLSYNENEWKEDTSGRYPRILKKYQIDAGMQPVVFWRSISELSEAISKCLKRVSLSREELVTLADAKRYFLSIGRRPDKVFISNEHAQNNIGVPLAKRLEEEGINTFHYMNDPIPVGTRDWLNRVRQEIDESGIFIALLSRKYLESQWCQVELDHAIARYKNGDTKIHPYLVENMEWPEERLKYTQGKDLTLRSESEDKWIDFIVSQIILNLEMQDEDQRVTVQEAKAKEINVFYSHEFGLLGTFDKIENSLLKNTKHKELRLNIDLLNEFRRVGAMASDWKKIVDIMGKAIRESVFQKGNEIYEQYRNIIINNASMQKKLVHFCFATDRSGFVIPFEWMFTSENNPLPLCLEHPAHRMLYEYSNPRSGLHYLRKSEITVLLIASNTGGIPEVDEEINDIEKLLIEKMGIPQENISKLNTPLSSIDQIEKEITSGKYHLLHFAGHGNFDDRNGAFLQAYERLGSSKTRSVSITAPMLKEWLSQSSIRFAYFSSCYSLEMGIENSRTPTQFRFKSIQGLAQAAIEGRVPEVIGFHWPIMDSESRQIANSFYEFFSDSLNASDALFEARRKFADLDARIWATPILIRQY
ncbi:MAG: TIR domain-containing protein [Chloroflexota bacterium]